MVRPTPRRALLRAAALTLALGASASALVWACGPFFSDLVTVASSQPPDRQAYDRGNLGVVKPTYHRRYLIQAYRTISGAPQASLEPEPPVDSPDALGRWRAVRQQVLPREPSPRIQTDRVLPTFNSFTNCLDDSFENAAETLEDRALQYGPTSREVANWIRGQDDVFRNCGGAELTLPETAPSWADAQLRADRDYQTAAAFFYAMQYEEAAARFRAIATDRGSSWRPYGRYLAGRAMIRFATVPDADAASVEARLRMAQEDLQATLADPGTIALHASVRALLDLIDARIDPVASLHTMSERLSKDETVSPQTLIDYTRLFDRIRLRPIEKNDPSLRIDPAVLADGDDMTAWIVAMQGDDERVVEKWLSSPTDPWLVAALWQANPMHGSVPRLLDAAARVRAASPAYPTIAFLRIRMLIQRGELNEARRILADLPTTTTPGFSSETLNLLDSARFAVAGSLDEMLTVAPRRLVSVQIDGEPGATSSVAQFSKPVWDEDATLVFNNRLPLSLLVDAAESDRLPSRLRLRVAQAAFTRSIVLERIDAQQRAGRVLRRLAPPLRTDVDRYLTASDDERRRLGALMLLRTPGLSIWVQGSDTDYSYGRAEPARRFAHGFARNWWCTFTPGPVEASGEVLYGMGQAPSVPAFVTDEQRAALGREMAALSARGEPREWLMSAALAWAREQRGDQRAAEALALSIEGWRWSPCKFDSTSTLPGRAFAVLHRQFPGSEWAKRTRYWYH